jgi:hypothetical protein
MPKFCLIFLIFFSFLNKAICFGQIQELQNIKSERIFLNKKENSFLLFDDSTYFFEYKISKKKWEKHPYIFEGECSFKEFQNEFIPISMDNGEIYFVYRGVGEVYGLINDTVKRIDRSFRHENQFDGNLFTHKNKIFCFGGYGLFTTKNFISYFNLKFKEWMVDDIPLKYKKPNSRMNAYSQIVGNNFYMMSGHWSNSIESKIYSDVWRYSIEKNRWLRLGKLNPNGINPKYLDWYDTEQASSKIIRIKDLYEIDFEKNKVKTYSSVDYMMIHHPLFDATEKYICVIIQKSTTNFKAAVYPRKVLLGKPDKIVDLYLPDAPKKDYNIFLLILGAFSFAVFIFIFILIKRRKRKVFKLLHKYKGEYYLNDGLLSAEFNSIDYNVLLQFLTAENNTLEIADINRIVEYDNVSSDASKKRREQSLKNIREKLSLYGKIPIEDVLISSQHPQDRRIKLLRLNLKLISN